MEQAISKGALAGQQIGSKVQSDLNIAIGMLCPTGMQGPTAVRESLLPLPHCASSRLPVPWRSVRLLECAIGLSLAVPQGGFDLYFFLN